MSARKCGGSSRELVEEQDRTGPDGTRRDEAGRGGARLASKGYRFFKPLAGLTNSNKKSSWSLVVKGPHRENSPTLFNRVTTSFPFTNDSRRNSKHTGSGPVLKKVVRYR